MRILASVTGVLALGVLLGAAQDKPKDIKEVMAVAHKGKESIVEKIKAGSASDDDKKKLVGLYEAMAGMKPPKGDDKSWKDKTDALLAAAKEVADKKDGAVDKLKKASDCKACHSVHKGK